jgi:Plasmid pRiA4b ORF-3-like protein
MAQQAHVFIAKLDGWPGVRRSIAVRADQTLADLHNALQAGFDWDDDHLYVFWLDGKFWSRNGAQYVHPFALEADPFAGWDLPIAKPRRKSAAVRLSRLRLTTGQRIAYLFDFGDEWRVRLTLRQIVAADGEPYPRILESVGEAPPQYPDYGADEEAA